LRYGTDLDRGASHRSRSRLRYGTDLDRGASHRSRSRTMDTTIEQQAAMDEALVPHAQSAAIKMLTDVNINKLYQPWRSFVAIINKCLTGKSSCYDSLRLSQAQILDDYMFSTIKLVSRYQNTQQFGALLPIELTNEEIRNSNAYKEYYAIVTRAAPPKPNDSVRRTRSSFDISITPPTVAVSPRLTASAKGNKQLKRADNKGKDGDDDEEDEGDDGEEGDGDDDDDDEDDDGEEGDDDDAN
nr:hypothetical protein [Tanacetum cinerariifolium]